MMGRHMWTGAALALALLATPAVAQQKVPVQFAKGASSATLKGSISGDQFRDYLVNARAGQTLSVTLTNPDGRAYFNVLPPGSTGEAVFIGSTEGNSFRGPVTANGNTTVRVYQMRASGRRGEVAAVYVQSADNRLSLRQLRLGDAVVLLVDVVGDRGGQGLRIAGRLALA